MALRLHNTLTKKLEEFTPLSDKRVTLYTCGPTVYDYPHVGNWAANIYWDILVRTLIVNGYKVERVMNITDVGHLVSDADDGEDKLEKGARREGKTAWEIAEFYAEDFLAGMEKLGLIPPEHVTKATDFIDQQLDLVRTLKEKGYTYQTTDGIYFDTAKFPTYADFAGLDLKAQRAGARVEANDEKRQAWDFALWKFTPAGQKRDMEWETPDDLLELPRFENSEPGASFDSDSAFPAEARQDRKVDQLASSRSEKKDGIGRTSKNEEPIMGFPGWHLECSAMAMDILGSTIDIHTGGIDHIPVHHTNEIAQSEAASGQQFSRFWLHCNHLKIEGGKISKSLGNGYTLQDIEKRGFSPMDLRLFVLQSDFMSEGNFTWENLEAAKNRLHNWRGYAALRHQIHDRLTDDTVKDDSDEYLAFYEPTSALKVALSDNLSTPRALQIIDEAFARLDSVALDTVHRASFYDFIQMIDELLGLQLEVSSPDISDDNKRLILERMRAREVADWHRSDQIRDTLAKDGIAVRDTSHGTVWSYLG